ncbi:hypothetical protein V8E53_009131 [Lactarius tabidus]|jgi:hypothetical protein
MNSSSREGLQQTIDAKIKSLEESVRSLKLRRNALSPISLLPPDVFIAIFSLLCLPGTSYHFYHPTLLVSHVCHQWRKIALDQPLLWSHVNFTTQPGAAEILVRAKSAPLYLDANASYYHWYDVRFCTFRRELQARVPNICRLRTCARSNHLQTILEELVSPAPTLENLLLSSDCRGNQRKRTRRRCPIPDTLFDGSTPRLSCLEIRYCDISWNSPLLKGLKYLEIHEPSANARPDLTVWLGTLEEMSQLKALTLHSASPIAPPLPFDVERAVTLPFLTHLDISGSPGDCALVLAHLNLPALTSLCLSAITSQPRRDGVQILVPYITRHAHGPQDTQSLHSVHIRSQSSRTDILAWPEPDVGVEVEVNHPPTFPGTMLPTRVALSFGSNDWLGFEKPLETLEMVLAGLPLGGLVMFAAHELRGSPHNGDLPTQHFWLHHLPKWSLLQRVRLSPDAARGFVETLLEDGSGRERPLLPSLTELMIVDFSLYSLSLLPLYDALKTRVEQGVPVERLDLRMCHTHPDGRAEGWFQSLSEVVVDVLAPEKRFEARKQMKSMPRTVACGLFADDHSDSTGCVSVSDTEDEYSL